MDTQLDIIAQIKAAGTFEEIHDLLRHVDLPRLSPRHRTVINRAIQRTGIAPHKKIAYLSNFVVDLLPDVLNVHAAQQSLALNHYVGGYNQYFQEILDPEGQLAIFDPDLIFLALSMRQLNPELSLGFAGLSTGHKQEILEATLKHLEEWYQSANDRFRCHFLIANFPLPQHVQLGVADQKNGFGEMAFYFELNRRLYELFSRYSNVFIFDAARLIARFGSERVFDPKMYYMAKLEWSEAFLPLVGDEILRLLTAIDGRAKKCIVLDLDNTLWGGVVGEDGPRGVKVGTGDPVAEAFYDFQQRLRSMKDRGILLAVCSKNNEEDVRELFDLRKEMPLKFDDFAAMRINWENKAKNIAELASELNIGLDSIVFFDDNPVECELIAQMLPQVEAIRLPEDPSTYASLIDNLRFFEKASVLDSDREKTRQYIENRQRKTLQESVGDLTTYLHSLGTEIDIRKPQAGDLDRVHQLFTKTNQFNVTTIRYSVPQINEMVAGEGQDLYIFDARDKFGSLGTVGLYLVRYSDGAARVDSFILSCRAMGRGIESAVMNHLKQLCFETHELPKLTAEYAPTAKNKPVAMFFEEQGFDIESQSGDGAKTYRLDRSRNQLIDCAWITVNLEDG